MTGEHPGWGSSWEKFDWWRRAQAVIRGEKPADLLVRNCTVLNTYTGVLLPQQTVGVLGPYIAYVTGKEMPAGPDTVVVDGSGKYVVPGFIDGHSHLDEGVLTVPEFIRFGVAGGSTVFVTNLLEIANALGQYGMNWFMESCLDQPIHIYFLAPTMIPGHADLLIGHHIVPDEVAELLSKPGILGLSESYWPRIFHEEERFLPLFCLAESMGKAVEGHGAGAKGPNLNIFAASGVTSCHESISVADAEERLSMGIFTILREGQTHQDLSAVAALSQKDMDFRHLGLCTDGVDPPQLVSLGAMEYVVQRAIDVGFHPVTAIQMATINNATYFRLDRCLGSVTPGRFADFMLLPDLKTIKAELVVSKGRILARHGRLEVEPRQCEYPSKAMEILDFSRHFSPREFRLEVPPTGQSATVRVIHQRGDVVTDEVVMNLETRNGELVLPPGLNQAVAISALEPKTYSAGLVSGWNLKEGACASSAPWNAPHIVGVGATAEELALAVNRVSELGGGMVVCRGREIVSELPMPIGGIISTLPAEEVAARMDEATAALRDLGYPYQNPLLALRVFCFNGVPRLRLTARGLMSIGSNGAELVSLFL